MSSADRLRAPLTAIRSAPPKLLAALAAVGLLVAVAVVLLARDGGPGPPPAAAATRLVPADALVYVHLSTDRDREGTEEAEAVARRFPGFESALEGLAGRLSAPQCGVEPKDVEGKEVALALLDAGDGQAGSLVFVDTGTDQAKAGERSCGAVQVIGVGDFLVVGQPQSLQRARELGEGKGRSLADDALYRTATARLGAGRVLDGWVTARGVRELLAPQSGLLGAAGTLLDQPGLRAAAFGVAAADGGARLTVASQLDGRRRAGTFAPFTPSMAEEVPAGAVAYLGLSGLSTATTRLLGSAGADGGLTALAPLVGRARSELSKQAGGRLDEDLLALFRQEVAVAITPSDPAPTLTIIARTRDAAATQATLRRLQGPLARILGTPGEAAPRWKRVGEDWMLVPAEGIEIHYGVFDDKLVLSTRRAGIEAARAPDGRLSEDADFARVVGEAPSKPVTSLVFIDFSQLLRLGERTGLNDSKAYLAAKDDLQRVRAIGARSTTDGRQSTAELFFSIP